MQPRPPVAARTPEELPHRALPSRYQTLLNDGVQDLYGAEFSIMLQMVWCGWSRYEAVQAFMALENAGGYRYHRMRNEAKAKRRLSRDFDKAHAKVAQELSSTNPDPGGLADTVTKLAEHAAHAITGRGGPTDLAVFTVLIQRAQLVRSMKAPISLRGLALEIGISPEQVRRSLHRLRDQHGVLEDVSTSEKGTVVRLSASKEVTASCTPCARQEAVTLLDSVQPHEHALFTPRALGFRSGLIYAALTGQHTACEIASATRLPRSTTYAYLRRMQSAGVVDAHDGTWSRTNSDLDHVATLFDVEGKSERQKEKFEAERREWEKFKSKQKDDLRVSRARAMDWQRERQKILEEDRLRRPRGWRPPSTPDGAAGVA